MLKIHSEKTTAHYIPKDRRKSLAYMYHYIYYILNKDIQEFLVKISKKISNDQELIQSDPTSCPQNQKGNN